MGLFSKDQIIKFEQNLCNASVNDNKVLFVRVSDIITTKDAKIEVPFTHNALIIKGGSDCRFYKSGHYDVFENKAEAKDWKKGFSVEVIYIPKETSVIIYWGTASKLTYRDPLSAKVVSIGASGQFGINVSNGEQFFRKVVGARKEFDLNDFTQRFRAEVVDAFADVFLNVVAENNISYDGFDTNRRKIAQLVGKELADKFSRSWGIELVDFIIEAFSISEEDKGKVETVLERKIIEEKAKEGFRELERLDDKQWDREKYVLNLSKEDRKAYYDSVGAKGGKGASFCPNCGHSVEQTSAFCPNCGNKLGNKKSVCPDCGAEVTSSQKFCALCGKKL